ncbi:MAG: DUF4190 domain-containing protein [Ktedonobacterales bacterium]|jgi:hypothetical protein
MTTPYGEYPQYQPPTGPTTQQEYPSQPYQPYPPQEQPPYQGSYPPPPPPPQQPSGYAQPYSPQYAQQYAPSPGYAPVGPTSGMAIASLVCSLLGIGLVGVILGHLALNEINKSNGYTQGRGLAIAGLIIGYLQIAAAVIFVIFIIIGIAAAASAPTQ